MERENVPDKQIKMGEEAEREKGEKEEMFVVVSRRRISGGYKVRGREGRRNIWRGRNTIILNTKAARGEAIASGGGKGRVTGRRAEGREFGGRAR